jgi:hypothetical protein
MVNVHAKKQRIWWDLTRKEKPEVVEIQQLKRTAVPGEGDGETDVELLYSAIFTNAKILVRIGKSWEKVLCVANNYSRTQLRLGLIQGASP